MPLARKLAALNWGLVLLLTILAGVGFAMLFSAANGSLDPWSKRQMIRFGVGLSVMTAVAVIDIRFWMRWAYLGYAGALVLLVAVEIGGSTGMGAQRWIQLGFFQIQPSELMKIMLVLALARYFHGATLEDMGRIGYLLGPLFLMAAPIALVLRQPDLGTALLLGAGGAAIFWLAGIRPWVVGMVAVGV